MHNTNEMFHQTVTLLMYHCPQADIKLVQHTVVRAMRHLVSETCLLQTSIKPVLEEGVTQYDYEDLVIEGYEVCQVLWVKLHDCCIHPINECKPCDCGYELVSDTCIRLHNMPTGCIPDALEIKVAMMPDYNVCFLPKELKKHKDLIFDLALAMLMKMPKKPWTDMSGAREYMNNVKGMIADVSAKVSMRNAPEQHDTRHLTYLV